MLYLHNTKQIFMQNSLNFFDYFFTNTFYTIATSNGVIQKKVSILADSSILLLLLLLVVFVLFNKSEYKKTLWGMFSIYNTKIALLAITTGFIARFVVKEFVLLFIQRPRPYVAYPNEILPLIAPNMKELYESFPSGHTIFCFAIATILYRYNKTYGYIAYVISIVVGLSRVFAGVHYMTDILAAAILGVVTALGTHAIYKKYLKKYLEHHF
jgi:membrane-associated phospholipid phosphatase